jgi:hypothetical protein
VDIPCVVDWALPSAGPQQKEDHFDADRKPVPDMTAGEAVALQRYEAYENKRAAIACQRHLRDLIKHHGGKGHR